MPASLAVATLIVCTFWGIASGLVGAVVVLMGVIAFNPMLKAGYDVKLASGVITAGGTLGILIPPSVMIIVYAAVAGQSVVKLYAAAMFPGFFLSFLYLVYIIGWAMINPKIAPPLPEEQTKVPVPDWMRKFQAAYSRNDLLVASLQRLVSPSRATAIETEQRAASPTGLLLKNFVAALVPFMLVAGTLWLVWWYVVIHQQAAALEAVVRACSNWARPGLDTGPATPAEQGPPQGFYLWFGGIALVCALLAGSLLLAAGCRPARGHQAVVVVDHAARHSHRRRSRRHPVRHHDRDRSPPASAPPAPSCWRSRPGRSTGSAPRRRCS